MVLYTRTHLPKFTGRTIYLGIDSNRCLTGFYDPSGKQEILDALMGWAARVMIAAGFWSLLVLSLKWLLTKSSLNEYLLPLDSYHLQQCAMIYVVVEELIPESQLNGNTDIATLVLCRTFLL